MNCSVSRAELNHDRSQIALAISQAETAQAQLALIDNLAKQLVQGVTVGKVGFDDLFYRAGELMTAQHFSRRSDRPARVYESAADVLFLAARSLAFEHLDLVDAPFMDLEELLNTAENA